MDLYHHTITTTLIRANPQVFCYAALLCAPQRHISRINLREHQCVNARVNLDFWSLQLPFFGNQFF
jgi:hypothetical protein